MVGPDFIVECFSAFISRPEKVEETHIAIKLRGLSWHDKGCGTKLSDSGIAQGRVFFSLPITSTLLFQLEVKGFLSHLFLSSCACYLSSFFNCKWLTVTMVFTRRKLPYTIT